MNYSVICKRQAKKMFSQCYGRLLLLGLCLSFPPACMSGAIRLFNRCIQPVGDTKKWLRLIVLPRFRSLIFQRETLFLLIASCLLFLMLNIFVLSVFSVGIRRYILACKKDKEVSIKDSLFWGFTNGSYGNIVKVMFLRSLYIALWSLLLLIPGLVKSLEYLPVPWLLAQNGKKPPSIIFRHAKYRMRGRKLDAFLTFYFSSLILWELLNAWVSALVFSPSLTGSVFPLIMSQAGAVLFVFPYRILTEGEFFLLIGDSRRMQALIKEEGEKEVIEPIDEDEAPGLFWRKS